MKKLLTVVLVYMMSIGCGAEAAGVITPHWSNTIIDDLVVGGSPYVDVRKYATTTVGIPDDGLDDSAAFASALSGGNKTVLIPDGQWEIGGSTPWLNVEDNTTILMGRHAVLNFTGDNTSYRYGFRLNGVSNIKIVGGILKGNRATQVSGNGIGIQVTNGSYDVTIEDVYAQDWYLDAFIIGGGLSTSYNVRLLNSTAYNCRRNGAAITGLTRDIYVSGCTFDSTNGTSPQVGLDIEPDAGETAQGISVANSFFKNNTGDGLRVTSGSGTATNITFFDNKAYSNGGYGIYISGVVKGAATANEMWNNTTAGMTISSASYWSVSGNTFDNNAKNLEVSTTTDSSFTGNVLRNSVGDDGALFQLGCSRISFTGNIIRGSGYYGLHLDNVSDSAFESSVITTSQYSGIALTTAVDNISLRNNIVKDNRAVGSGSWDGIAVGTATNSSITGNVIRGAHRYGIWIGPGPTNNIVMFNDLLDATVVSASFSDSGTGTVTYYDNTYSNWNRVN